MIAYTCIVAAISGLKIVGNFERLFGLVSNLNAIWFLAVSLVAEADKLGFSGCVSSS